MPALTRLAETVRTMERKHEKYERLIARCRSLTPNRSAVAHACDESSLRSAVDAAKAGLIAPILVGPGARVEALARQHGVEMAKRAAVRGPHSGATAAATAALVRVSTAEAPRNSSMHTPGPMTAVVNREARLRTVRGISQCCVR